MGFLIMDDKFLNLASKAQVIKTTTPAHATQKMLVIHFRKNGKPFTIQSDAVKDSEFDPAVHRSMIAEKLKLFVESRPEANFDFGK